MPVSGPARAMLLLIPLSVFVSAVGAQTAGDGGSEFLGDVLLLHQGRCGSTLLLSSLRDVGLAQEFGVPKLVGSSAPELGKKLQAWPLRSVPVFPYDPDGVAEEDELAWHTQQLSRFRDQAHALVPGSARIIESVKLSQLIGTGLSIGDFLSAARAAGFSQLVVIHRSYLRSAVSLSLVEARKDAVWHDWGETRAGAKGKTNCEGFRMDLPVSSLVPRFNLLHRLYRDVVLEDSVYSEEDGSKLVMSYENHLYLDPRAGRDMVLAFLGLAELALRRGSAAAWRLPMGKTADCELHDIMTQESWDELVSLLSGTPLQWLLETEGRQVQGRLPRELLEGV